MQYFFKLVSVVLITLLGTSLAAQESENGALVSWIEDKLSSPNRIIKLSGIEGVLSSEAHIGTVSISDTDGEWLRIDDAQINWKRSALLTGSLQIESLTAAVIEISRAPLADQSLPTPEAAGFALPELPLDIDIAEIVANRIIFGEDLFGLAAELSATLSGRLDADGAALNMDAVRLDGAGGQLALEFEYQRAAATFSVNLALEEPENGVIANALSIEGTPAIDVRLSGQGPLDDLTIALALDSAGYNLINGRLRMGQSEQGRTFTGQFDGQLSPLIPQDYRGFFEGNSTIHVEGVLRAEGGVAVPNLRIQSADMLVSGSLETTADGFPSKIQLNADIAQKDGSPVILPFANGLTLAEAKLSIGFGETENGDWDVRFTATDLASETLSAALLSGQLSGTSNNITDVDLRNLSGVLRLSAQGLASTDADVAQAMGGAVAADADFDWTANMPIVLSSAQISGDKANIRANGHFAGLEFVGEITGEVADLAFLTPFAGRPLSGGVIFQSIGKLALLGGAIDTDLSGTGWDVSIGEARVDSLLVGSSQFTTGLKRGETGVLVRDLAIRSDTAKVELNATLSSQTLDANGSAELAELTPLIEGLSGPGRLEFLANGPINAPIILADLSTNSGTLAHATGTLGPDMDLTAEITNFPTSVLNYFAENLALEGYASGSITVATIEETIKTTFDVVASGVNAGILQSYNLGALSLGASGSFFKQEIVLSAAQITGRDGLAVDLNGRIPLNREDIDVTFSGDAPLTFAGEILARSGIVATGTSSFEMRMAGSLTQPEFFGSFAVQNTAINLQRFKVAFDRIVAAGTASGRRITLSSLTARSTAGGDLTANGHIDLTAGFPAVLEIKANNVLYSDGRIFSTVFNTDVTIEGPLLGGPALRGSIRINDTEIQVPSGNATAGILLDVIHAQPPTPVRRTLRRAGLSPAGGEAVEETASLNMDLDILSPGRIFVRGRGLDAELGGAMRVTGASPNTQTNGRFDLIRGRMDLLGRRLEFTEGTIAVTGDLNPAINFIARTKADDLDITIQLAGLISAPELTMSSVPHLPEDEILARLIFGNGIDDLSIFQIAQLASAVADLSGRSSGGLASQLRELAGLDNLDIRTVDGQTSVAAGKYIQENIYSEIEANAAGDSKFSINLDVIEDVKARAERSSAGETEIGIFFEKDY